MSNSNLPTGCAYDERAPFNQKEVNVKIHLERKSWTFCCLDENYSVINGEIICGTCSCKCSIEDESEHEYEERYKEEEEKELYRIETGYYED